MTHSIEVTPEEVVDLRMNWGTFLDRYIKDGNKIKIIDVEHLRRFCWRIFNISLRLLNLFKGKK